MSDDLTAPVVTSTAVMLALDKLSVSRLHLQQALMPPPKPGLSTHPSNGFTLTGWLDRLAKAPAMSVVLDTVQRWWARHPLRLGLLLVGDAAQTLIEPTVQKHPYRLVLVAAATGALLILTKPWRWLPRAVLTPALTSTLLAGLLPPLTTQTVSPMTSGAWMELLAGLTRPRDVPQHRR